MLLKLVIRNINIHIFTYRFCLIQNHESFNNDNEWFYTFIHITRRALILLNVKRIKTVKTFGLYSDKLAISTTRNRVTRIHFYSKRIYRSNKILNTHRISIYTHHTVRSLPPRPTCRLGEIFSLSVNEEGLKQLGTIPAKVVSKLFRCFRISFIFIFFDYFVFTSSPAAESAITPPQSARR